MNPLEDRIIIEILPDEIKAGSIILQNKRENQKTKGKIIAIGCGLKYLQDEIKVGDVILYKKYAGTRITLEDKDCVMLREAELDAVLF
uniref:Co-chaperonin GroES n=1 Tax=uncultured virus TaxID=340016 RepID=A0A221S3I5_9VIRU|nr:co-chaperonin GroES [uncultured virus]